jgi:hypothetical protein
VPSKSPYSKSIFPNPAVPLPLGRMLRLALVALLSGACLACGYTVERYAGARDVNAPRIAIATLENDSSEPGVERLVSEALRRECLRRGRYRLVDDAQDADWVLGGRVLPLEKRTQTLSSVVLALEQTVTLRVELELQKPGSAPIKLQSAPLFESEIFLASADLEAARKNKTEALRRISGLIAERAHNAVDAEWTK